MILLVCEECVILIDAKTVFRRVPVKCQCRNRKLESSIHKIEPSQISYNHIMNMNFARLNLKCYWAASMSFDP